MTCVGAGIMDNSNLISHSPWPVVVGSLVMWALDENIINEPFLFMHNDDMCRTNGRNDSCDSWQSLGGVTPGGGTGEGTGKATGVRSRGEATPTGRGDAGTRGGNIRLAGGVATAGGGDTTGLTGGTATAAAGGAAGGSEPGGGGAAFTLRMFSLVCFIVLPPRW